MITQRMLSGGSLMGGGVKGLNLSKTYCYCLNTIGSLSLDKRRLAPDISTLSDYITFTKVDAYTYEVSVLRDLWLNFSSTIANGHSSYTGFMYIADTKNNATANKCAICVGTDNDPNFINAQIGSVSFYVSANTTFYVSGTGSTGINYITIGLLD